MMPSKQFPCVSYLKNIQKCRLQKSILKLKNKNPYIKSDFSQINSEKIHNFSLILGFKKIFFRARTQELMPNLEQNLSFAELEKFSYSAIGLNSVHLYVSII